MLDRKCKLLEILILDMTKRYSDLENDFNLSNESKEEGKAFLETIIGAAIFYLPGGKKLFNNQISKDAWNSGKPKSKLTKEHFYPRKWSAKQLLTQDVIHFKGDGETLKQLYLNKYGLYNLVTSKENTSLRELQKNFDEYTSWDELYTDKEINIKLLNKGFDEIKKGRKIE
tara:strand:+ start:101 stop:613 length:513 start_codon:yes stop_codon:yes gene_type:complete